jgi:hypothetical protein
MDIAAANDTAPGVRYNRLVVPKLTPERRFAFEEIAPTALWIAANLTGAQQRFWGDNQGGWPVMMGLTQSWEDRKSAALAANEPYQERALIARFWCDEWDEADRLWQDTYGSLRTHFDDGRGEWMSFTGDESSLALLTSEIRRHAGRNRTEIWTDAEMLRRFDWLILAAKKVGA